MEFARNLLLLILFVKHICYLVDAQQDQLCSLVAESGVGCDFTTQPQIRFYFSPELGSCQPFNYNGCGGNANNFLTMTQCTLRCRNYQPSNINVQPPILGRCQQIMDSGLKCTNSILVRFFYNTEEGYCQPFVYGGCGGNSNNFMDKAECEQTCFHQQSCTDPLKEYNACGSACPADCKNPNGHANCMEHCVPGCFCKAPRMFHNSRQWRTTSCVLPSECSQPENPVPGSQMGNVCNYPMEPGTRCAQIGQRWFYDATSNTCRSFQYQGCMGNGNNFLTLADCFNTCVLKLFGG